jgi:hypothetical protein
MQYLVKDEKLELKYEPGKGAWTYHIQIPNTKHIIGKWGSLKAAGTIDDFQIESINLFTIAGRDKMISVNEKIRKSIHKTAGDTVTVTLYLLNPKTQLQESEIVATLADAGVLDAFNKLPAAERTAIIETIISQKSEDQQVKSILKYINLLS